MNEKFFSRISTRKSGNFDFVEVAAASSSLQERNSRSYTDQI